jgi:hypothetical protein
MTSEGKPTKRVVVGIRPTPDDTYWQTAAAALTPDKSFANLQTNAKYILGGVTTVGTVLTGIGILGASRLSSESVPLGITISLTALSVALAMAALVLRVQAVNIGDLIAVKAFWTSLLRWRGMLVRLAGSAFALALLSAGVTAAIAASSSGAPTGMASLSVTGTGMASKLSASVQFAGLPSNASVVTKVVGELPNGSSVLLLSDESQADSGGGVTVSDTVPDGTAYSRFILDSTAMVGDSVLRHEHEVLAVSAT